MECWSFSLPERCNFAVVGISREWMSRQNRMNFVLDSSLVHNAHVFICKDVNEKEESLDRLARRTRTCHKYSVRGRSVFIRWSFLLYSLFFLFLSFSSDVFRLCVTNTNKRSRTYVHWSNTNENASALISLLFESWTYLPERLVCWYSGN